MCDDEKRVKVQQIEIPFLAQKLASLISQKFFFISFIKYESLWCLREFCLWGLNPNALIMRLEAIRQESQKLTKR
jgi:hypothetical protein